MKILDILQKSRPAALFSAFLLVLVTSLLDYYTGYELRLTVFYLVPIFLAAWDVGLLTGVLVSILSGLIIALTDWATGKPYSHEAYILWDGAVRTGVFIVIAYSFYYLRTSLDKERTLARTDDLAGVANRRYFFEMLENEIQRAERYGHPFSLIYTDLDDFKAVNDRFGHTAGDAVLRRLAGAMRANTRATDVVARLGGDEFAVLLPETDIESARSVVRKVSAALRSEFGEGEPRITLSIGLLVVRSLPYSVDALIKAADALMYQSKGEGKNTIREGIL
jgi:diguanylate cyclase (GGDEF)-like protein